MGKVEELNDMYDSPIVRQVLAHLNPRMWYGHTINIVVIADNSVEGPSIPTLDD